MLSICYDDGRVYKGGFWSTVLARDFGIVVPPLQPEEVPLVGQSLVFDSDICVDFGENGLKGMNAICPKPQGSINSCLRGCMTDEARLKTTQQLVATRVKDLLDPGVLQVVPDPDCAQVLEHSFCEWMRGRLAAIKQILCFRSFP